MQKAVPTLDPLQNVLPIPDNTCYLCGQAVETLHHLALECPITLYLWSQSPWQIKLEAFKHLQFAKWVCLVFGKDCPFPIGDDEQLKLRYFFVTTLEQVWLARNHTRKTNIPIIWKDVALTVCRDWVRHWRAGLKRLSKRKGSRQLNYSSKWIPPLDGQFKFNFDAAFHDGKSTVGCVLRNSHGLCFRKSVLRRNRSGYPNF